MKKQTFPNKMLIPIGKTRGYFIDEHVEEGNFTSVGGFVTTDISPIKDIYTESFLSYNNLAAQ